MKKLFVILLFLVACSDGAEEVKPVEECYLEEIIFNRYNDRFSEGPKGRLSIINSDSSLRLIRSRWESRVFDKTIQFNEYGVSAIDNRRFRYYKDTLRDSFVSDPQGRITSKDYYLYKNGKLYQITTMELNNRENLEIKWRKFFYYDDNNNIIKVERYVHYGSYYDHHSNYEFSYDHDIINPSARIKHFATGVTGGGIDLMHFNVLADFTGYQKALYISPNLHTGIKYYQVNSLGEANSVCESYRDSIVHYQNGFVEQLDVNWNPYHCDTNEFRPSGNDNEWYIRNYKYSCE